MTILNSQASRGRAARWLLVGALLLAAAPRPSAASGYARPAPPLPAPTSRDRVLVLAPHPDDESVPCGGLVAEAVAAGAQVRVVYATYGDAFRAAAQKVFSESVVSSRDYLRLAQLRHQEALAALAKLGLSKEQAIFLGYPDRGLGQLWLSHWSSSSPYRSPYTEADHGPYPESYRKDSPYSGLALLSDLTAVISEFRPTLVVAPHPLDTHVDHWALYCFTLAALHRSHLLGRLPLWLYLVHPANKWLSPARRLLDPTAPPSHADEVRTQWGALTLTGDSARRKREAIEQYATQLLLMHNFLLNFARARERYGQIAPSPLSEFALGGSAPSEAEWRELPAILTRFPKEPGGKPPAPGANLLVLRGARSRGRLLLRLDLAGKPSPEMQYRVHLYPLAEGAAPRTYTLQLGRPTPGVSFRAAGHSLLVEIAEAPLPLDGLLLSVDTRRGQAILERTAWARLKPNANRMTGGAS